MKIHLSRRTIPWNDNGYGQILMRRLPIMTFLFLCLRTNLLGHLKMTDKEEQEGTKWLPIDVVIHFGGVVVYEPEYHYTGNLMKVFKNVHLDYLSEDIQREMYKNANPNYVYGVVELHIAPPCVGIDHGLGQPNEEADMMQLWDAYNGLEKLDIYVVESGSPIKEVEFAVLNINAHGFTNSSTVASIRKKNGGACRATKTSSSRKTIKIRKTRAKSRILDTKIPWEVEQAQWEHDRGLPKTWPQVESISVTEEQPETCAEDCETIEESGCEISSNLVSQDQLEPKGKIGANIFETTLEFRSDDRGNLVSQNNGIKSKKITPRRMELTQADSEEGYFLHVEQDQEFVPYDESWLNEGINRPEDENVFGILRRDDVPLTSATSDKGDIRGNIPSKHPKNNQPQGNGDDDGYFNGCVEEWNEPLVEDLATFYAPIAEDDDGNVAENLTFYPDIELHASPIQKTKTFQIKTIGQGHICDRQYDNRNCTFTYLSKKYQYLIRAAPNILLQGLIDIVNMEFQVEITVRQACWLERRAMADIHRVQMEQVILNKNLELSRYCRPYYSSPDIYEVDWGSNVDDCYTKKTYLKTYALPVGAMPSKDHWERQRPPKVSGNQRQGSDTHQGGSNYVQRAATEQSGGNKVHVVTTRHDSVQGQGSVPHPNPLAKKSINGVASHGRNSQPSNTITFSQPVARQTTPSNSQEYQWGKLSEGPPSFANVLKAIKARKMQLQKPIKEERMDLDYLCDKKLVQGSYDQDDETVINFRVQTEGNDSLMEISVQEYQGSLTLGAP
ncbi:OLC1v1013140C2 [Oldenlandia corymbosa var. corymbosa]|nr:OLC1v1013140C2 [Oldenlandia corymbosa var. corymbosa]